MKDIFYRFGLKFKRSLLETEYSTFHEESSKKFFFISAIAFFSFWLINSLSTLISQGNQLVLKSAITLCSLVVLCFNKKFPNLYTSFFILIPLCCFAYLMVFFKELTDSANKYYLIGNFIGCFEIIFLLGIKGITLKLIVVIIFSGSRIAMLREDFSPDLVALTLSLGAYLMIFCLLINQFARTGLEKREKYHSEFVRLQNFLSKNLSISILIISADLQECIFYNNFFQDTFGIMNDTLTKNQLSLFLKDFIVDSIPRTSGSNFSNENLTLIDFIQQIPKNFEEDQRKTRFEVFTISTTLYSEVGSFDQYEVKFSKLMWKDQLCYSLIFEKVTSQQISRASKLADEEKDRMIATLSHELRTPINGIVGLLEIIGAQITDSAIQKYMSYCKSCTNLLLYLVNSMLDLSQARQNNLQINKITFSLDELLKEIKSFYIFQTQQKGIIFNIEKASGVPTYIYTDKSRLIGILIHLLSNAFKFTFSGSITLSISIDEKEPNKLLFSIKDTGVGIKDEQKSKLMTMFGRIENNNGNNYSHGVGLGLTVANTLARALNGSNNEKEIYFESEYDKGSTFSFKILFRNPYLPLSIAIHRADGISSQSNESEFKEFESGEVSLNKKIKTFFSHLSHSSNLHVNRSTSTGNIIKNSSTNWGALKVPRFSSQGHRGKHVLVVDDNPFNLLTASFILEKMGLVVTKACSGKDCIQLLERSAAEHEQHYDLILMDIQMPILNGLETSKIITDKITEKKLYNVPIIALTANQMTEKALEEYKKNGILHALEKPLKEKDLEEIINSYFI